MLVDGQVRCTAASNIAVDVANIWLRAGSSILPRPARGMPHVPQVAGHHTPGMLSLISLISAVVRFLSTAGHL